MSKRMLGMLTLFAGLAVVVVVVLLSTKGRTVQYSAVTAATAVNAAQATYTAANGGITNFIGANGGGSVYATAGAIAYATAYVGASGNGPAAATAGARAYYGKAARTAAAVAYATDPAVDLTVGEIAIQTDVAGATATAAAGGDNTTPNTPTVTPSNSTLHVCAFAHYDSAHYMCLQDDTSVGISDNSVEVTFPNETSDGKIMAYTLNILKRDGTGKYAVVNTEQLGCTVADNFCGGGVRQAAQKLIDIETGTGYSPACNDDIELQEVDLDGKVMGAAPLHIACM